MALKQISKAMVRKMMHGLDCRGILQGRLQGGYGCSPQPRFPAEPVMTESKLLQNHFDFQVVCLLRELNLIVAR